MERKSKNNRTSEQELRQTNDVVGSAASISLPGGRSLTADLLSTTDPLSTVPRFSQEGLDYIAGQNLRHDGFFKWLRSSAYRKEWEYISSLPDPGSREWKMIALSFCAQVAIESTLVYPWLGSQAYRWLEAKFVEQGVPDDFKSRWETYLYHCGNDLQLIEGDLYLHAAGSIRFRWFGNPPRAMSSLKYRMSAEEILT